MNKALLYPIVAMVALHYLVAARLLFFRIRLRFKKETTDYVQKREEWASNNFKNLFEMPVLFYVAMLLSLIGQVTSPIIAGLAWAFVALRYCHSFIHCVFNYIPLRFTCFQISLWMLSGLWIMVILSLLK